MLIRITSARSFWRNKWSSRREGEPHRSGKQNSQGLEEPRSLHILSCCDYMYLRAVIKGPIIRGRYAFATEQISEIFNVLGGGQ